MALTSPILEGVLLIDKPIGYTAHDIVDRVRRKLQMRRVGHAGTLDPLATGVMIILVGRATKASQYLMSLSKAYKGTIKLGEVTDTQDSDGKVLVSMPVPPLTLEQLQAEANTFIGDQYQTPPMFSAKKVQGVPLYKLARKGKIVTREPCFIRIDSFSIDSVDLPEVKFSLACTKGTYVRTVAHDLGQKLGCGAHLTQLCRVATGSFNIKESTPLVEFEQMNILAVRHQLIPTIKAIPSHIL